MLNHLYRYTVRQELQEGPFHFLPEKPAAFFPGTFDPFSVGHKQIVQEIRARGFEVYLAVDEFSWSKRRSRSSCGAGSSPSPWPTSGIRICSRMISRSTSPCRTIFPGCSRCLRAGSCISSRAAT